VLETKACTRQIARVPTHPSVWYAYPAALKRWSPWNGAKPEPCGEQLSAEPCYGKRPSLFDEKAPSAYLEATRNLQRERRVGGRRYP
jgi:hypothetical protein